MTYNNFTYNSAAVTTSNFVPNRVTDTVPSLYRMFKKLDGTVIMQGMFRWVEGSHSGGDWKEIEMVSELPAVSPITTFAQMRLTELIRGLGLDPETINLHPDQLFSVGQAFNNQSKLTQHQSQLNTARAALDRHIDMMVRASHDT